MKNYQKNSRNLFMAFSCMFEQYLSSVLDKTNKWHLTNHIWSLNLNLVFKPNSFNCVASCISSINNILPCHYHASCCALHWLCSFSIAGDCPLSVDAAPTLWSLTLMKTQCYLQKCQASKTPLFIPIQSHSLAPALFYCIRTTTIQLLLAAVVEPLILCMICHCHSK